MKRVKDHEITYMTSGSEKIAMKICGRCNEHLELKNFDKKQNEKYYHLCMTCEELENNKKENRISKPRYISKKRKQKPKPRKECKKPTIKLVKKTTEIDVEGEIIEKYNNRGWTKKELCRTYDISYNKLYRILYGDNHNKKRYKSTKKYTNRNKEFINSIKTACIACGENEKTCIDFHHLNPEKKVATVSSMVRGSLEKLKQEVSKCICLCSNCHRKFHAGILHLNNVNISSITSEQ